MFDPMLKAAARAEQQNFEYFQTWRFHSFSGQPVPALNCPHRENLFHVSNWNYPCCNLCLLPLVLLLLASGKRQVRFLYSWKFSSKLEITFTGQVVYILVLMRTNHPDTLPSNGFLRWSLKPPVMEMPQLR